MPLVSPDPVDGVIQDNSGCQNTIGYVIDLKPSGGGAACWLELEARHRNRNDLMHGGIMAILLDVACGYAASLSFDAASIAPVLTVSLNLHYVAPVAGGRVTAIATVSGGGRKICYANGELRDSDGALIASAAGVFRRISKRPDAGLGPE